jgi:hypothetical protein
VRRGALGLAALLVATGGAAGAAPAPAGAATCTTSWAEAADGAWADVTNWTDGVPDADDTACLTAGGTVTLSASAAVADLEIGPGTTLVLDGDVTLTAGVDENGFSGTGGLVNAGVLDLGTHGDIAGWALTQQAGGRLDVTLTSSNGHTGAVGTMALAGTVRVTVPSPLVPATTYGIVGCTCWNDEWSWPTPPPVTVVGSQELRLTRSAFVGLQARTPRLAEDSFVRAAYVTLLGNFPARPEEVDDVDELLAGTLTRTRLARDLTHHTGHWTHEVLRLYTDVLGRVTVDAADRDFWVRALRRGDTTLERLAASMYGSREYLARVGGTPAALVTALFADVLGRAPSDADRAFWTGQLAQVGRGTVAFRVAQSREGRRRLAAATIEEVLRRDPLPAERVYWSDHLLTHGRNDLLFRLVAAYEFRSVAHRHFAYS